MLNHRLSLATSTASRGRQNHQQKNNATLLVDLYQFRGDDQLPFTATDVFPEAGRRTILKQFHRFLAHEEGTRLGEDIEELHDMRVASRRMRAAFRVFGKAIGKPLIAPYQHQLQWIAWELGKVRDLDVFLAYLREYRGACLPENRQGLGALIQDRESARRGARTALLAAIDSEQFSNFKQSFAAFLDEELPPLFALRDGHKTVAQGAAKDLRKRFQAVIDYDERVQVSPSPETFHELRIAIKRFRYSAEFFRDIYEGTLDPVIAECRQMQDALGEMHDVDVHRSYLTGFAISLRNGVQSSREQRAAIDALLQSESSRRAEQQRKFERVWGEWEQGDRRRHYVNNFSRIVGIGHPLPSTATMDACSPAGPALDNRPQKER
ncbi:MAG: hypothetical protein CO095_06380 [Armatimonadetes bacterium CG_4_9_14_3_um_filter_58_7]|nr:MAG: hypothetical protein CO095_06380 [Armatimonadetes bacterium CG_4_9_14_3_um_filter_58_7]